MTKPERYYLNQDANGMLFVSKNPMNQNYYSTPMILHCIPAGLKKITYDKKVRIGTVCVTTKNEKLEVVSFRNRKGYKFQ